MIDKHQETALRVVISRDKSRESRQSRHSYEEAGVSHGARRKGRMASPSPLVGPANLAGLGQLYRGVGLSRPAKFDWRSAARAQLRQASRSITRARVSLAAEPEFCQAPKGLFRDINACARG